VNDEKNISKIILLSISAILGAALLVSGIILIGHMDTLFAHNDIEEDKEVIEEPPPEPVEQRRIEELPPSDGYTLVRNPTEYQLELFDLLVNSQNQFYDAGSDDYLKAYTSAIVRNFIAEFFTLSNKNSRTDVGGLQFFSEDIVDNFRRLAIDDFYLYLNQYLAIFGNESLPTVASTEILDARFGTRIIEDDDEDIAEITPYSYLDYDYEEEIQGEEVRTIIIDASWTYENSTLRYIDNFQTVARFVLLEHEEGVRIYIVEMPESDHEGYAELDYESYN